MYFHVWIENKEENVSLEWKLYKLFGIYQTFQCILFRTTTKQLKVSEYPFKQNKSMLKNMTVLLYTYFFNISLNVPRPTFFNICSLPFLRSPNIGKIRVKVEPKTYYFSYFMSSCTTRIAAFSNFFSLVDSQRRDKQNRASDFFLLNVFWIISFWSFLWKLRFQNSSNYYYKKWTTYY